jgi:hypothetical protein
MLGYPDVAVKVKLLLWMRKLACTTSGAKAFFHAG